MSTNRLIEKVINRLIDNENKSLVAALLAICAIKMKWGRRKGVSNTVQALYGKQVYIKAERGQDQSRGDYINAECSGRISDSRPFSAACCPIHLMTLRALFTIPFIPKATMC